MRKRRLVRRVRWLLGGFIVVLTLSGLTAVPLPQEIAGLDAVMGEGTAIGNHWPAMARWVSYLHGGIVHVDHEHPYMLYGTDWLAMGHIVIALMLAGPWRDPVRNVWVVQCSIAACVMVLPVALGLGPMRKIPFFHQLIDCSFGVVGIVPLWIVHRDIRAIEALSSPTAS